MTMFFAALYSRVWLSYKSTILGLLVAAFGEAIAYLANGGSTVGLPSWVHVLAGIVLVPFLAWKDKEVKDCALVDLQPRGFLSIKVAVALLVCGTVVLGLAGCATFKTDVKQAEIDCAATFKATEALELASLKSGVATILISSGANWQAVGIQQLEDLVANSRPLALCVIASVENDFRTRDVKVAALTAASFSCPSGDTVSPHVAAERAHFYLADKPVKITGLP